MQMGEAEQRLLIEFTQTLGIQVQPALPKLNRLLKLLIEANRTTNLTAIRDADGITIRHFLDSLTCLLADPMEGNKRLLDLGSGPGFPGLPIKLVKPKLNITFLEANQKKTSFIEHVIHELNLEEAHVIWGRAEELAHKATLREQFDIVTARAVSSLPTVCELGLPFLKIAGKLIIMKGPEVEQEIKIGEIAAHRLGGEIKTDIALELPRNDGQRRIIVIEKTNSTPAKYPRRTGVPERKPLGY